MVVIFVENEKLLLPAGYTTTTTLIKSVRKMELSCGNYQCMKIE